MGMYVTARCPHCNSIVEGRRRLGINDYGNSFGPSEDVCPYCKKAYATGRKDWESKDSVEKSLNYIQLLVTIPTSALYYMFPVTLGSVLLGIELTSEKIKIALLVCFFVSLILNILNFIQCINYKEAN